MLPKIITLNKMVFKKFHIRQIKFWHNKHNFNYTSLKKANAYAVQDAVIIQVLENILISDPRHCKGPNCKREKRLLP